MTVGVPLPDAPGTLADRRVFTTNGVDFTVADLARRAGVGGREVLSAATAASAEERFRRARGLLTADRLESWLAGWQVDPDDFRRWTEDVAAGTATATRWCAFVCSGELDAITAELASAAAAACELGAGPTSADFDPAGWTERLLAERAGPEALAAVVEAHRLDWTRLETVSVTTAARGVAEELRHQVLSDGAELVAAAEAVGYLAEHADAVLADTPSAAVRATLAGALVGELLGPVQVDGTWQLVSVLARTEPSVDDPRTRERATASVRHELISSAVARHVVA